MNRSTQFILDEGVHILILVGLAVGVLFSGLAGNTIPMDASSIYNDWPWEDARPVGMVPSDDAVGHAEARTIYPAYTFLAQAPGEKDGLLWNSLEGFGYPFFASWESRCLSPFSIPIYLFGPTQALAFSAFLKMLVAGLAAYYAARMLGFHGPFALLVAVAYELCGHFILLPTHPVSDVMPWVPLYILFVERLALGQGRYWAAGAGIGALMLAGGDGAAVAIVWLFGLCYLLTRFALMERAASRRAILAYYTVATGLALGLAGIQLAPYIEWFRLSIPNTLDAVHAAGFRELPAIFSLGFVPTGDGADPVSTRISGLLHMGFVQLLLVVLWCALRHCVEGPHRQRIDALLSVSAAFFLIGIVAGPLVERFTDVQMGTQQWLAANAFAFALGGAAAAESWLELRPEHCTSSLKRLVVLLSGVAIVGALAVAVTTHIGGINGSLVPDATFILALTLVFALMVAATLLKPSPRLMAYGMAALTAADLLAAFLPLAARTHVEQVYPQNAIIEGLSESSMRIAAGGDEAWALGGSLVPHLPGTQSRTLRQTAEYMNTVNDNPFMLQTAGGVGLILGTEDIRHRDGDRGKWDGDGGKWASARSGLRLKHVFPSGKGLFQTVSRPGRAWLEPLDPPLDAPAQELEEPSIDGESNKGLVVRTQSAVPTSLVVAEAFFPGWKARAEETPITIFPKDGLFRSVKLPAGEHTVEFYFEPTSLRTGMWISIASAVVVLMGLVHLLRSIARTHRDRM